MKKLLINYIDEFKNRKLFGWKEDRRNGIDKGSYFNVLTLDKLKELEIIIVDNSEMGL